MPRTSDLLCWSLAILIGAALLLGFRPVITSGTSMAPAITSGSVLVTSPVPAAELVPGDVAVIRHPDGFPVAHRVVSSAPLPDGLFELVLRGDANPSEDPPVRVADARLVLFHLTPGALLLGVVSLLGATLAIRRVRGR